MNITLENLFSRRDHEEALPSIQYSSREKVKLDFPKPDHVFCMYTDACKAFWAAVITKTKEKQLAQPAEQQRHEPLAFLGGEFAGAQRNWSTYEKEAYSVVQTFERMDLHLWGTKRMHVYNDHKNLLYVFVSLALRPYSLRHVISKFHRWVIHLFNLKRLMNHMEGLTNIIADVLT